MKKPEELLKKAGFVLKSNYLESGNTIFAPPYVFIFMEETKFETKLENKFLEGQHLPSFVWSQYVDDIFSSGPMVKSALRNF